MVCWAWASGYYGTAFKYGHGVIQGGPLSAKQFNILLDGVIQEWIQQLQWGGEYEKDKLFKMMVTFFAIYVDNAYLASQDAGFLQHMLDILVNLIERVGLQMNTSKMQTMICMLRRIWMQLLMESYRWMQHGLVMALEWNFCNLNAGSAGRF